MNGVYPNINKEQCFQYENYFLDYFNERALKLFRFDTIRILRILEISYYIIIFSVITLLLGGWINGWFSRPDPTKTTGQLFGEILPNMLILGVTIFYIEKIALLFPFPLGQRFGYCPGNRKQIGFAVTVGQGLVLFSTQIRLQGKVRIIANRWDNDPFT